MSMCTKPLYTCACVSDKDFSIQSMLGGKAAVILGGYSLYSTYALGQDWTDHLNSQKDTDDSVHNSIFFHLA